MGDQFPEVLGTLIEGRVSRSIGTLAGTATAGFPHRSGSHRKQLHETMQNGDAVTITEESRYQLYKQLEATLGPDHSNTLMEHLPPVGWADVATKTDLAHLQAALTADISLLRSELEQDRTTNAAEFERIRSELEQDRTTNAAEFERSRKCADSMEERLTLRFQKDLAEGLHRQFVQLIASMAALLAVWSALAVIVGQFLIR